MQDEDFYADHDGRPSKSQVKRDMLALQELADRMSGLTNTELERLGVDAQLRAVVAELRRMKPSGARNRHLKYAMRFMQDSDLSQVQHYLDNRQSHQVEINQKFHALERWRDRLIEEGDDVLGELLDDHPSFDRQRLRQLIRDAQRERDSAKPTGAARKLFRYLREEMLANG